MGTCMLPGTFMHRWRYRLLKWQSRFVPAADAEAEAAAEAAVAAAAAAADATAVLLHTSEHADHQTTKWLRLARNGQRRCGSQS